LPRAGADSDDGIGGLDSDPGESGFIHSRFYDVVQGVERVDFIRVWHDEL